MAKFDENAMIVLRERLGLKKDDTSKDDRINNYTPKQALEEICAWTLGNSSWADIFEDWCKWVGLKIN